MSHAKIIKSAHRRAGSPQPLKTFARKHATEDSVLGYACNAWLACKCGEKPVHSVKAPRRSYEDSQRDEATALLSRFPSKAGKSVTFERLVGLSYWHTKRVNDVLGYLLKGGYIEQTDEGYARTRDSGSLAQRKGAK